MKTYETEEQCGQRPALVIIWTGTIKLPYPLGPYWYRDQLLSDTDFPGDHRGLSICPTELHTLPFLTSEGQSFVRDWISEHILVVQMEFSKQLTIDCYVIMLQGKTVLSRDGVTIVGVRIANIIYWTLTDPWLQVITTTLPIHTLYNSLEHKFTSSRPAVSPPVFL
jgi:hypothetical protein